MELDAIVIDRETKEMQFIFRYVRGYQWHLKFNRLVRLNFDTIIKVIKANCFVQIEDVPNHDYIKKFFIKAMCEHYGIRLKIY